MSDGTARRGLEAALADALADLANASLDLDPATRARLAALDGYRIQITASLPKPLGDQHFGLAVRDGGLRFHPRGFRPGGARPGGAEPAGAEPADVEPPGGDGPHVVVRGTPPDLAAWLFLGEGTPGSRLAVDGDSTALAQLMGVLREFRPDPTGPLSRLLGPELASRAVGTVELGLAALRSALQGAGASVRQGAAQTFVDRDQAERFLDELDELRLRVDRLAARVDAEERRRTSP